MPAMLDDPTASTLYRVTGTAPPEQPGQALPVSIQPRQVTLRDRTTVATLMPVGPGDHVPPRLMNFLCELLNNEIRVGNTYPMIEEIPIESFRPYWFQNFAAIMLMGDVLRVEELQSMEERGTDWKDVCMGSFYIKPNYPGRSSHICNGGFLVSNASRNRGVGKLMGEGYLEWAPKLGYVYSVFNLVYETNTASIRIWDALGFKRIGRVKGCGQLASHPNIYVDAIIYGRDLGADSEDLVSEERFDKIRYYLKHQKYPVGADRAEKSRLRSAATHYHLDPGAPGEEDRLMLKDKEVIADQNKQYEIARQMHSQSHGGINKTTATIAEKYHWVRIKETVSLVIKNCTECKENNKVANSYTNKENPASTIVTSKTPPKMLPPNPPVIDGTSTPPHTLGQLRSQQTMQSFEQPLAPSMPSNSSISRDLPPPRQSPLHQHTPVSAPTSIPLQNQTVLPPRPLLQGTHQTPHTGTLTQPSPLHGHLSQSIIPPHINNHLGMTMNSAHGTPTGSAVHSPLPTGPASAPISNMQQPFDIHQLDPLLHGLPQYSPQDMSAATMDDAMQGMGPLDMDTNMQDLGDLNAMGLGDPSVHNMVEHAALTHGGHPAGGVHMGHMGAQHGGPSDGLLDPQDPHAHGPVKHEMPDFSADSMLLDAGIDLSKPPNMG